MNEFFSLRIRIWGLLTVAGFLAAIGTVAGFLGQYAWWLDLGSHFRVQYVIFFTLLTVCYVLGRRNRWAFAALCFALINASPVALFLIPSKTVVPAAGDSLRAMLINVNTELGNPDRLIACIKHENPDIIVLEEISDKWVTSLNSILKIYAFQKIETRDDNFGIGLLSRIPCISTQVVYFADADVPSIVAELEIKGRRFTLIATHPLPPAGPAYSSCRNARRAWLRHPKAITPNDLRLNLPSKRSLGLFF